MSLIYIITESNNRKRTEFKFYDTDVKEKEEGR